MDLSKRSRQVGDSPLRMLSGLVGKIEKKGIQVYRLNIGEPDEYPPDEIIEYYKTIGRIKIPYAPSLGTEELRSAWSDFYFQQNLKVNPDNIVITTGASEALLFTFSALADPGDELIVFEPFYPNFYSIAKIVGVELKAIPFEKSNGQQTLPSENIVEQAISSRTRAILINNPSNPTGFVCSKEELVMLAKLAKKHDLSLIVDEVYRELVYEQSSQSALSLQEYHDRIIVIDSISKRFSLCGLRLGCVVSYREDFIKTINRFAQSRLSSPLLSQQAVIPALKNASAYTSSLVKSFAEKRQIVKKGLADMKDVEMIMPDGAFYAFMSAPIDDSEKFARWLLTEFSYEKQTVLIAPGTGFYLNPEDGRKEFRIAFVIEPDKLRKAITVLQKGLIKYLNK